MNEFIVHIESMNLKCLPLSFICFHKTYKQKYRIIVLYVDRYVDSKYLQIFYQVIHVMEYACYKQYDIIILFHLFLSNSQ